jgi:hypothetical protein
MGKMFVSVGILLSLALVSVPTDSYADPQQATPQFTADCVAFLKNENFKPSVLHLFGEQAVNKQKAINFFKRAEQAYLCEGNKDGVKKTREAIANIDKINFAKNREIMIRDSKEVIMMYRQRGDFSTAAAYEANIAEIRRMKD